jgi:hypothetical protein
MTSELGKILMDVTNRTDSDVLQRKGVTSNICCKGLQLKDGLNESSFFVKAR